MEMSIQSVSEMPERDRLDNASVVSSATAVRELSVYETHEAIRQSHPQ